MRISRAKRRSVARVRSPTRAHARELRSVVAFPWGGARALPAGTRTRRTQQAPSQAQSTPLGQRAPACCGVACRGGEGGRGDGVHEEQHYFCVRSRLDTAFSACFRLYYWPHNRLDRTQCQSSLETIQNLKQSFPKGGTRLSFSSVRQSGEDVPPSGLPLRQSACACCASLGHQANLARGASVRGGRRGGGGARRLCVARAARSHGAACCPRAPSRRRAAPAARSGCARGCRRWRSQTKRFQTPRGVRRRPGGAGKRQRGGMRRQWQMSARGRQMRRVSLAPGSRATLRAYPSLLTTYDSVEGS